jgi:IS5 family transposase
VNRRQAAATRERDVLELSRRRGLRSRRRCRGGRHAGQDREALACDAQLNEGRVVRFHRGGVQGASMLFAVGIPFLCWRRSRFYRPSA